MITAMITAVTIAASCPATATAAVKSAARPAAKPAARSVAHEKAPAAAREKSPTPRPEGQHWDLPARLYSDTCVVYPGLRIDTEGFRRRIERLGYASVGGTPSRRGTYSYSRRSQAFDIYLHEFRYPDHAEPGRLIQMTLDDSGRIVSMRQDDREIAQFFLEPALLAGGVDGGQGQGQAAAAEESLPPLLVRAALASGDRRLFADRAGAAPSLALAMNHDDSGTLQDVPSQTSSIVASALAAPIVRIGGNPAPQSHEEIEGFLGQAYFGTSGGAPVHGVRDASETFFGREPDALSVAQVATLAGMIGSPDSNSAQRHPERATVRRDVILAQLRDQGEIDQKTFENAVGEPLEVSAPRLGVLRAPYFVDYVSRELSHRFPARIGEGAGYTIFTTLDPEMQEIAEHVVADNVVEMEHDIGDALAKAGQPLEAAMVVMEPRTGAVRAMVGGRDGGAMTFNRAIDMRRQPGSTFKSIVALAALGSEHVGARHFKPTSTVVDEKMEWEWQGQVWSPRNYENEFYGVVTVREAIEHSLNSAVARIAKDIGVKPIRDLAVRMGMTPDLGVYPSIVLGGQPVPLLDMAKVFSVYATGGMRVPPMSVHAVVDPSGQIVEGSARDIRRIVPATDAYLVTHLLEGVMERGTGAAARRKGFKHPAAGKTGTSNDYKDAWFVGFTPNLLAAVWVGFDEPATMGMPGSEAALPIWIDFMRQALGDTPHDSFEVPPGIMLVDVDKKNGKIARPQCPKQIREAFLAGEEPHEVCDEHGGDWR